MTTPTPLHGHADEGFGPLADAFAANFADHGETGAACAVYQGGREVVHLWAGTADDGRPWQADTVAPVFSVTKALLAITAYMLAERGLLDLDAPISAYWPEFARAGKEAVTVRDALSHRAGLPALDEDLTVADLAAWDPVLRAIEPQKPLWTPGAAHRYHPLTLGWLVGEPIRRVSGLTPGGFIDAEIARPLRADAWVGLPDEPRDRLARIRSDDPGPTGPLGRSVADRAVSLGQVFPNGLLAEPGGVNDTSILAVEIPSGGAVASAPALARILAATVGEVDGVRLMGEDSVRDALTVRSDGPDWEGALGWKFSTGFKLNAALGRILLSDASFGHDGAGGQLAFADAEANLGFGYVNGAIRHPDPRADHLVLALRACLA